MYDYYRFTMKLYSKKIQLAGVFVSVSEEIFLALIEQTCRLKQKKTDKTHLKAYRIAASLFKKIIPSETERKRGLISTRG